MSWVAIILLILFGVWLLRNKRRSRSQMPVSSSDIQKLFEDFSALHYASEVRAWDVDAATDFDRNVYDAVMKTVVETGKDPVTGVPWYWAPSSWVAAIFLMDRQARQGFWISGPVDAKPGENYKSQSFKLVFRGQNAKHKDIRPTAWRLEAGEKKRYACAVGAFCFLLKSVTEKNISMSLQAHLYHAAAQHYELPTDLLDWTVDASIAIWFAHWKALADDKDGVVYFTNYEYEPKLKLVLPPPFVKTLFHERGFFHYTTVPDENTALFHNAARITFPLDASFYPAPCYPLFTRSKLKGPDDKLLLELVNEVIAIADSVDADHFEDLNHEDEAVKQAAVDRLTIEFADKIEELSVKYRFTKEYWRDLEKYWVVEIHRFINELFTFEMPGGKSFVAKESIFDLIPLNRDALDLYCNSMLMNEKFKDTWHYLLEVRKRLDEKFPFLTKRGGHPSQRKPKK